MTTRSYTLSRQSAQARNDGILRGQHAYLRNSSGIANNKGRLSFYLLPSLRLELGVGYAFVSAAAFDDPVAKTKLR